MCASYVRFATHHGFRPDWCESADPQSKGVVEDLVGYATTDLVVPACDGWTSLAQSIGSVLVRCVPLTRRCADTHAGLSSTSCHRPATPVRRPAAGGNARTPPPRPHQRRPHRQRRTHPSGEALHPDTIQRELERRGQPPASEVDHRRRRRRLAHIHRHRDQPVQRHPNRTRRQLLRPGTMHVHHEAHLPVVSGEPGASTPDPRTLCGSLLTPRTRSAPSTTQSRST